MCGTIGGNHKEKIYQVTLSLYGCTISSETVVNILHVHSRS